MIDYSSYYKTYFEAYPTRTNGKPYIRKFLALVGANNIPVWEWREFHDKWKHQLGRGYAKTTMMHYRNACQRFIDYSISHTVHETTNDTLKEDKKEKKSKIKKGIVIHSTIHGLDFKGL